MNIVKKALRLYNTLYFHLHKKNAVLINSCVVSVGNRLYPHNFGDDLNFYLLKELYKIDTPINLRQTFLGHNLLNYLLIGSIIESYTNNKSIIWGSGAMHGTIDLKEKPLKVLAVRGPLTREYLLSQGVDCPPVYGDPALLLPDLYDPQLEKKYDVGIIPHITDLSNPIVDELQNLGYKIIRLNNYRSWRSIVDDIISCKCILSSSLHGLILSDAYNVNNTWIQIKPLNKGNDFKFRDYFSSVGREYELTNLNTLNDVKIAIEKTNTWKRVSIDLNPLRDCCPFK